MRPITRLHRLWAGVTACLLLATALAGVALLLAHDRAGTRAAAVSAQRNVATGLEHDILRNVDVYDLSLRAAAAGLRLLGDVKDPAVQNAILFDGSASAQYFRPIVIIDADGIIMHDAAGPAPHVASMAGRPVFEEQRTHPSGTLLARLIPRSPLDGQPALSLSRRITERDGSFGGIVAGGLKLGFFRDMFSRYALPRGSTIALIDNNGRIVVGHPPGIDRLGADAAPDLPKIWANQPDSTRETKARPGGSRLVTVRRLGQMPFALVITTPTHTIYAAWRDRVGAACAGVLVFIGCAAGLLIVLGGELAARRGAERTALAASAAARASEARLTTYIDHLPDGVLAIARRPDGQFAYERINVAACAMLDLDTQTALGRRPAEFTGPDAAFTEAKWRECEAASAPICFDENRTTAAGPRVLRTVLAPVHAAGAVNLLLASVRDVTESLALQARLSQAQRLEAVGQLTAGVAHDFNNMLQVQLGSLELLAAALPDQSRAHELATLALEAGEHGASLTQSLLSYSRQQYLAPAAIPLADLFDRLRDILRSQLGPAIALRLHVAPGLAAPYADRAHLEAALLNLTLNARDALARRGGTLAIEAHAPEPTDTPPDGLPPGAVLLTITDDGPGMTPEIVAHACEPFFTTKALGKGSGLGLSMVQGFVRQSGGAMRIGSSPGQGTRIELWLPSVSAAGSAGALAAPGRGTTSGRILLVDDSPDVLAITTDLLEEAGFTVVQAAHGEEALSLLATEHPFDVLVTDYTMPGISGGELVRCALARFPQLSALVLTGHAEVESLIDLPPGVAVAGKPMRGAALARHVLDAMDRARVTHPAEAQAG